MYSGQLEIVTALLPPPPPLLFDPPLEPQAASTAGATAAPASTVPARPRNRRRDMAARVNRAASARMSSSFLAMRAPSAQLVVDPGRPDPFTPAEQPSAVGIPHDPHRIARPQQRQL